jgi:hypothetical protein
MVSVSNFGAGWSAAGAGLASAEHSQAILALADHHRTRRRISADATIMW